MAGKWVTGLLLAAASFAASTPQELMDNGHHKRVRALAEPLYKEHPNDPEAQWMMSFVKLTWGDHKMALELAEKSVAADPKNSRYRLGLAQALGEEAQQASIFRQPGLAHRFKKELTTVLSIDPKNVEAMKFSIMYDFEAPGFMGGDKAEGKALVDRIMAVDQVEGYLAQVMLARYEKQENRVEEAMRKALEAGPQHYQAHMTLANHYLNAGKNLPEVESLSRQAIRIDPDRGSAHSALAVSLIQQGKWDEVDGALEQSAKDVADDLTPFFRAGQACLTKPDQAARAERYFRRYLSQEPEPYAAKPAFVHWRLGLAMEKQGHKAEAIGEWQTAIKMDPESPAKADLKRLK